MAAIAIPRDDGTSSGERVGLATRAALVDELLRSGAIADFAHPLVLALAIALVWERMPLPMIIGWAAAVVTATVLRAAVRRHARDEAYPPERALRMVRLTVGGLAIAWGIGAAVAVPDLPVRTLALLLVLCTGLVSGAFTTLTPDPTSARLFIGGMLGPIAIGVTFSARDREHYLALAMIGLYGTFMLIQMKRAHAALLERLQMSARLRVSEEAAVRERHATDALIESAPVAIAVVDGDGRVRRINPAFEQLFGFGGAEAMGRRLDDLIVPPAGRTAAAELHQRASRGGTVRAELDRMRHDGTRVPIRLSAAPVSGAAAGDVFVVYEDLTERRRAAEATSRLAGIVESSSDAIYSQDATGRTLSWNRAAERLYGYKAAEILGQPAELLTPPDRHAELHEMHERLRRGEDCPPFETERVRRDGARIAVSIAAAPVRGPDGTVVGFSKIVRDISREVAARRALEEARLAAERAAQARASFLANMSHEIRTPMNAILGFSELLLETELSAEQRHSLGLVQSSAQTLLTLIDDILDFSKIEADQVRLEAIAFDLPHLVDSTAGLLSVRARERRLEVLAHVATDLPAKVRGDPTRLRQVLTNLIGNAIKFTHEGEIVVSASAAGGDGERQAVRFAVRDTGIGIPAEKLETIFHEFTQADTSTTRRYGGTGLGLTIARRLVRLMGGELTVQSQVNVGTEFAFTVSLGVEAPDDHALPAAGAAHLAGRRTLIVDDHATNRAIVRDVLASAGVPTTEAEAGDVAFDILQRSAQEGQPFELVILDAQMPGLDGFALAGAVRGHPALADTPLVMLTSAGQRGDGQRCRELGIQGYLTKPVSRGELLDTIAAVLSGAARGPAPDVVTRHTVAESRRRLRILLAEDNPVNQEVAATVLRKRGHQVDVVGDGRAATLAVAQHAYDVVLMDIQMPVMDGLEATRAIRATDAGRHLPIIALTAHAQRGEREECLAQGMTDYITKPFKALDLFAVVEGRAAAPAQTATPAVDVEAFRREMRAAGAEDAVAAILATFTSTAPGRLQDLEAAVAAGEADSIRRAAHAYKSAAATIGARELARLLGEMEAAARGGAVDTAIAALAPARAAHAAALEEVARVTARG